MTLLMPLEIRGLGTPDVESLPSYLHRLANAHGVTVTALLKRVKKWYQEKHPERHIILSKSCAAGDLSVYVRPNQGTEDLVLMLGESLGNKDLVGTTFLPLYRTIARTAGIFSQTVRWCPMCVQNFFVNQNPGYFKLLWSVNSITHCPSHHSKLIDRCPTCKKKQGGYGHKIDPRNCQKCGLPLSQTHLEDIDFNPSWSAQGADMLRLVEFISKHPRDVFQKDSVKDVISREFDMAWRSNTEDDLWKIIPKNECIGIAGGEIPITLKRARVIAYRFGIDLVDLLLGNLSNSPAVLDPKWSSKLPPDIRPIEKKENLARDIILEKIHGLMKACKDRPKPLCFYANAAGVSVGYLMYNFEALSNRILTVHKAWKKEEKERKQREAHSEALKLIVRHQGNPIGFSKKGALREITSKTNLPKEVIRAAINHVHKLLIQGEI